MRLGQAVEFLRRHRKGYVETRISGGDILLAGLTDVATVNGVVVQMDRPWPSMADIYKLEVYEVMKMG